MDFQTKNAWIFLAVAVASRDRPAKVPDISLAADSIAHAVPTQQEIQFALWMLTAKQLVSRSTGNRYELTVAGKRLYEEASETSKSVPEIWKSLADQLSTA